MARTINQARGLHKAGGDQPGGRIPSKPLPGHLYRFQASADGADAVSRRRETRVDRLDRDVERCTRSDVLEQERPVQDDSQVERSPEEHPFGKF